MIVYVVTQSIVEYLDGGVKGVFSTREAAQEWINSLEPLDRYEMEIDEFTIDAPGEA